MPNEIRVIKAKRINRVFNVCIFRVKHMKKWSNIFIKFKMTFTYQHCVFETLCFLIIVKKVIFIIEIPRIFYSMIYFLTCLYHDEFTINEWIKFLHHDSLWEEWWFFLGEMTIWL